MASSQQATTRAVFGSSSSLTSSRWKKQGSSIRLHNSSKKTQVPGRERSIGSASVNLNKGIVNVAAQGTTVAFADGSPVEEAEIARLREENERLRRIASEAIESLDEAKRSEFARQHSALQMAARAVGEDIPVLVPVEHHQESEVVVVPKALKSESTNEAAALVEETKETTAESVSEPVVAAEEEPAPKPIIMEDGGVAAVVEVERDIMVFKFDTASKEKAGVSISNASKSSSMSVDPAPNGGTKAASASTTAKRGRRSMSKAQKGDSESTSGTSSSNDGSQKNIIEESEGTLTFRFDSEEAATPSLSVSAAKELDAPKKRTTKTRSTSPKKKTSADSSATESSSSTTTETTTTTAKTSATKKVDPFAAAKTAATTESASHDPAAIVAGREYWLYFSVPETPVAGAKCTMYFNKAQSEVLRHSGRVVLHPRFNNWEVDPQEGGDSVEMTPASKINRAEGTDFYSVEFQVPEEAYEMNFVFSDGNAAFDNNNQENYGKPVDGAMTKELWLDSAPERAEAAYLAKKEEERVAAEKAEAERKAAAEAMDAENAQNAVNELKGAYDHWRAGAVKQQLGADGKTLWKLKPESAVAGKKVTLLYNRVAGPINFFDIPEDQSLVLKLGHNSWKGAGDVIMKRSASVAGEEWWEAVIEVPEEAAVINFVVNYYEHYDNNGGGDYRIAVDLPATAISIEVWADSMLSMLRSKIKATREAEEEKIAEKQRRREESRQAARDKALEVRRAQMRHVLFTEPEVIQAGKPVTLYYNPNNTVLAGRQKVYLRGSYNRWKHPKPYGPIEMTAPTTGEHFSATIDVPKDAYSLDFVFSEAEDGGQFDNRGGLDYHFDVKGAVVHEPSLRVCHIAVEMAPICKVGGLGDVVTSLSRAVQEQGHQVEVILPRYDFFLQSPLLGGTQYETEFDYAGTRIFVSTCMVEGLRCFFIEPANGMFATSTVYQGASDAGRFEFFCRAALEFLLRSHRQPDILHCHDWSSADIAKYYWTEWHNYGLWKPKVVFTIHNMNYGAAKLGEAAYFSQRFTTVSPSYAWEIGGSPVVAGNNGKLMGIRNGIDIDIWDPETDQFLPVHYTADNVREGKAAAREELRRRMGLSGWGDKPIVGVVTRLTKQKGTHLIAHSCYRTLDRGGQFVLLGSAPDPKVQAEFNGLAQTHQGENAAFAFAFDEPLSHLIYAAADIILVPSMFEPCGLTQMIAMRFGAVPVVRATGGLKDTVFDVDTDKARAAWELLGSTNAEDGVEATNGFAFDGTDEGALDYALNRALDAYYNDREWFRSLQERVMRQDWSWNKPAIDYIEMYWSILK